MAGGGTAVRLVFAVMPDRASRCVKRLILFVPLLALAACTITPSPQPSRPEVVLWGDSFGVDVAPYLPYEERVMNGTSPCAWLQGMAQQALTNPPEVAVVLCVGNGVLPGTTDLVGPCDWPDAVARITAGFESVGTRVVWIAAPTHPTFPLRATVNSILAPYGPAHGPADAIGGDIHVSDLRGPDDFHLSPHGAWRFAQAIEAVVAR